MIEDSFYNNIFIKFPLITFDRSIVLMFVIKCFNYIQLCNVCICLVSVIYYIVVVCNVLEFISREYVSLLTCLLFIHPFTYLSIYSVYSTIHSSIAIYPYIFLSIHLSIYLSSHSFFYPYFSFHHYIIIFIILFHCYYTGLHTCSCTAYMIFHCRSATFC